MRLLLILSILISVEAFSAVPKKNISDGSFKTEMALQMPIENRLQLLSDRPFIEVLDDLNSIAFNQKKSIGLRWKAVTAMGLVSGPNSVSSSIQYIERALMSSEWNLRNSGLLALKHLNREKAVEWAERFLKDPALVVRTAAVQVLIDLNSKASKRKLWKALNSPQNFSKNKSLWVRKHIVKALYKFADKGEASRFVQLLSDEDSRLHPYARKSIEKITGEKCSDPYCRVVLSNRI